MPTFITEIGWLFVLSLGFLDGFGVDFQFDLLTYRHHARLQNFVVIDFRLPGPVIVRSGDVE